MSLLVPLTLTSLVVALLFFPAPRADAVSQDQEIVFEGSGWGHGVGMSQYGAYGLALAGSSATQILGHYYRGTNVRNASDTNAASWIADSAQPLWIGLLQNRKAVEFAMSGGGASLCQGWGADSDCSLVAAAGETWRYSSTADGLCVFARIDPALPVLEGEPRDCDGSVRPGSGTTVRALDEGFDYSSGIFRLRAVDGNPQTFHLVLQIGLDDYLRGIAEMPTWWPLEALKAQVIAARSYLISNVSSKGPQSGFTSATKKNCWCHLYDDSRSQVYKGDILLGSSRWQAAVSQTAGRVVAYGSQLVRAFYSSSSGGWTENVEDYWIGSTPVPWLVSVDDHWAHIPEVNNWRSHWSIAKTAGQVASRLGLDELTTAKVSHRASGGVSKVEFVGTVGGATESVTRSGSWVKSAFGLPSHYFKVLGVAPPNATAYDTTSDGGMPLGWLEKVTDEVDSLRVRGWALDPDTPLPINVHIYVDGAFKTGVTADIPRGDVQKAHGNGKHHGFDVVVEASAGTHTVCVYAINAPTRKGNPRIGCKTVRVTTEETEPAPPPSSPPSGGNRPFGWLDVVSASDGELVSKGWAIDRDAPDDAVGIHVYVDGKFFTGARAQLSRPDVDRAFGLGSNHGFAIRKAIEPGSHRVCLYALNIPGKSNNTLLGCKTISG